VCDLVAPDQLGRVSSSFELGAGDYRQRAGSFLADSAPPAGGRNEREGWQANERLRDFSSSRLLWGRGGAFNASLGRDRAAARRMLQTALARARARENVRARRESFRSQAVEQLYTLH
jgi:hypothetical protein